MLLGDFLTFGFYAIEIFRQEKEEGISYDDLVPCQKQHGKRILGPMALFTDD